MAKTFSRGKRVWFKLNGYWSYGQVISFGAGENTYSVKIEGDPLRKHTVHTVTDEVQLYRAKYRKGRRIRFKHPAPDFASWGRIVGPTSPAGKHYYVSLEGDPLRGLILSVAEFR